MCSNYISCEGISLNQAHIVRNDDLRVEPSSSFVVSQSILAQHHLNLIKNLDELDWTFASWPEVFRQKEGRKYDGNGNEHLSVTHCQAFSVEHDLVQMFYHIWDFENQAKKWNCRVKKREGIPTSCPVTSIGKTGPRNSIKDLLVGSRILTTPSHLYEGE